MNSRMNEWSKQRFFAANSAKMNTLLKQRRQMRMAKAAKKKQQTLNAMEAVKNAFTSTPVSQTPDSETAEQSANESTT